MGLVLPLVPPSLTPIEVAYFGNLWSNTGSVKEVERKLCRAKARSIYNLILYGLPEPALHSNALTPGMGPGCFRTTSLI